MMNTILFLPWILVLHACHDRGGVGEVLKSLSLMMNTIHLTFTSDVFLSRKTFQAPTMRLSYSFVVASFLPGVSLCSLAHTTDDLTLTVEPRPLCLRVLMVAQKKFALATSVLARTAKNPSVPATSIKIPTHARVHCDALECVCSSPKVGKNRHVEPLGKFKPTRM